MKIESVNQKIFASGLLALLLVLSSGCMGVFGGSDTGAGDLTILNEDNRSHEVVIHGVGNGDVSRTVAAEGRRTVTLFDSPGSYTINATIDGTTRVNTTVDYSRAVERDKIAGPGLNLWIRPEVGAHLSRSYD